MEKLKNYKKATDKKNFVVKRPHQLHDKVFKATLKDIAIAKDFFKAYLPKFLVEKLNLETLQLEDDSYIDKGFKQQFSDILYRAKLENRQDCYLYLLVEHQSTAYKFMPIKIIKYTIEILERIYKKHKKDKNYKLPIIYPLVVYHGREKPYPYSNNVEDLFADPVLAAKIMFRHFNLIDLTIKENIELCQHGKVGLLEIVQKHIFIRDNGIFLKELVQ